MKLYLISQQRNTGYDSYDSAVVRAESETAAKLVHPDGDTDRFRMETWTNPEYVDVQLIGLCVEPCSSGVVCASFNAG